MNIVKNGSGEEMIGADTQRVVAAMTDEYRRGFEGAVLTLKDVPMGRYAFLVSPETTVPATDSATPIPTTSFICTVNEPPKAGERIGQLAGLAFVDSGRHGAIILKESDGGQRIKMSESAHDHKAK
jgi:hypothetical protein